VSSALEVVLVSSALEVVLVWSALEVVLVSSALEVVLVSSALGFIFCAEGACPWQRGCSCATQWFCGLLSSMGVAMVPMREPHRRLWGMRQLQQRTWFR
jgi:hypothetical protein